MIKTLVSNSVSVALPYFDAIKGMTVFFRSVKTLMGRFCDGGGGVRYVLYSRIIRVKLNFHDPLYSL